MKEHGGGGEAAEAAPAELPSFLDILGVDMHQQVWGLSLHEWLSVLMAFIVAGLLVLVAFLFTRKLQKIPRGAQSFLEMVVEGLYNFFKGIMGPKLAMQYLPFLGTLFLYIFIMNLSGLVPLMHSATNKYATTISLALIVFFTTHLVGCTKNGVWGYLKHLMGVVDCPGPLGWALAPIMFPIHLIGELVRPVSLSLRLFGNISGEDMVIYIMVSLSPLILGIVPIPFQFPILLLALLTSLIQAVVFVLLSSIYIAGAYGHHEEHEKEH